VSRAKPRWNEILSTEATTTFDFSARSNKIRFSAEATTFDFLPEAKTLGFLLLQQRNLSFAESNNDI
jgi:hypothetical protein